MSGSANSNILTNPAFSSSPASHVFSVTPQIGAKLATVTTVDHLSFVKLDVNLVPNLPKSSVGWLNNPMQLSLNSQNQNLYTDPGRISSRSDILQSTSNLHAQAIPTNHWAIPWMLQRSTLFPSANPTIQGSGMSGGVDTICTGPFICTLESDSSNHASMRLLVTVECEAGMAYVESVSTRNALYTNANNGVVFLANKDSPWTVYSVNPMTLVMISQKTNDITSSDRYVHITQGVMSIVYNGDDGGIVKNESALTTSLGNRTNQFGYGSVDLGAERVFFKVWDSKVTGDAPTASPASSSFPSEPSNGLFAPESMITEYLRFDKNANLKVFAKSSSTADLEEVPTSWSVITSAGGTVVNGINCIPAPTKFDKSIFKVTYTGANATGITGFGLDSSTSLLEVEAVSDLIFPTGSSITYTYYLTTEDNILAAGTAGDIKTVVPIAVLTIFIQNFDTNELMISYRIGNVWFPKMTGVPNPLIRPLAPITVRNNIPDFVDNAGNTMSPTPQENVFQYPIGKYGGIFSDPSTGTNFTGGISGVKNMFYDFNDTVDGKVVTTFKVDPYDIVAPLLTTTPGTSNKILFWDPIFDSTAVPDLITISRDNGYKIVELVQGGGGGVEYTYSRIVNTLVTDAVNGSTFEQKDNNGDFIVSNADIPGIINSLTSDFLTESSTNDSWLWKGIALKPTDDPIFGKKRIHGDILSWGRSAYRYARYIEMISRGKDLPFLETDYESSSVAKDVANTAAIGAHKLWIGARQVLSDGFVPEFFPLKDHINNGGLGTKFKGFDVLYNGPSGPSKGLVTIRDLQEFLTLNSHPYPAAASAALTSASISSVKLLGELDFASVATFVSGVNNTTLPLNQQFTEQSLLSFVALASKATDDFKFVDQLGEFCTLKYDRSSCDLYHDTSIWGGLTYRHGNQLAEWAVVTDLQGDPIVDGVPLPTPDGVASFNVLQLKYLGKPSVPTTSPSNDPSFKASGDFSYFTDHNISFGYLFYVINVALKYGGADKIYLFPDRTTLMTVAEDISLFLVDASASSSCNKEPLPLMQALLDVVGPLDTVGVKKERAGYNYRDVKSVKCVGAEFQAVDDGIIRSYPPHRHFDVFTGHSWSSGPKPGFEVVYQEGVSETVLAYLGAYRLISEYVKYLTKYSLLDKLTEVKGYLTTGPTFFAQTAYAILGSEVASSNMYHSTRLIEPVVSKTAYDSHGGTGVDLLSPTSKGGYPVTASKIFVVENLHKFITMSMAIGVSMRSIYALDQKAFRGFPAAFLIQVGSHLVPQSDLTPMINSPLWKSLVLGKNLLDSNGNEIIDDERLSTFGGILARDSSGSVVTVGKMINNLLATVDNTVPSTDINTDPNTQPSLEVLQWARAIAPSLGHQVTTPQPPNPLAVAFPAGSSGYLPQSSHYETLYAYKAQGITSQVAPPPLPTPPPTPPSNTVTIVVQSGLGDLKVFYQAHTLGLMKNNTTNAVIPDGGAGGFIDAFEDSTGYAISPGDLVKGYTLEGGGTYVMTGDFTKVSFNGPMASITNWANVIKNGGVSFRRVTNSSAFVLPRDYVMPANFQVKIHRDVTNSALSVGGVLSSWNVSAATLMSDMFYDCNSITSLVGLASWDVSLVASMGYMFGSTVGGTNSIQSLSGLESWDVSDVGNMESMFENCTVLNNIGALEFWATKVGEVTKMSNMFSGCASIVNLTPLALWVTTSLNNMSRMFKNCSSLVNASALKLWDISAVTILSLMFEGCLSLTTIDFSPWNVESVTDMSGMFLNCSSLNDLSSIQLWQFSPSLNSIASMFRGCSSLTTIDLRTWNTTNLTFMSLLFNGCSSLVTAHFGGDGADNATFFAPSSGWRFKTGETAGLMFAGTPFLSNATVLYTNLLSGDFNLAP